MEAKKALLVGASGLVGSFVLDLLLKDSTYSEVRVLARRSLDLKSKNEKLQEYILDFDNLKDLPPEIFQVDDVFSCLGNTSLRVENREQYLRIEIDYPVRLAELCAKQGARSFHYVSAIGASRKSKIKYSRMKGETEYKLKAIQAKNPSMSINSYRPSFIKGPRKQFRPVELALLPVLDLLGCFMRGKFAVYRSIHAETIAKGMITRAKDFKPGFHLIDSDKI